MEAVIQNSAIKGYLEFHAKLFKNKIKKFKNDSIFDSYSLNNEINLIVNLCNIKGTLLICKKYVNKKTFLLRFM